MNSSPMKEDMDHIEAARAERRAAPSRPAAPSGGGLPYPADRELA